MNGTPKRQKSFDIEGYIELLFILLFLLLFAFRSHAAGTDSLGKIRPEFRVYYGFVIRHHMDMGTYTTSHFSSFEVSISKQTTGSKTWHQFYKYPSYGISYWYSSLGNTAELGDVHAIFPWIRFPLVRKKKFSLNFRLGLGVGYFQKKFDRYLNYKNLAIGSHINGNIQLMYEARWQAGHHFNVSAGIGIAHFSNGTMVTPNYGINVPGISAGIELVPHHFSVPPKKQIDYKSPGFPELDVEVSNAVKKIHPILGKTYMVYVLSASYLKTLNLKHKAGFGLDVFYDGSDQDLVWRETGIKPGQAEIIKPGIKAVYEWDLGRLFIDTELGFYLWQKEKSTGSVYDKLVIKYSVAGNVNLIFYLKTHYARADFIGWGIGYRIRRK